MAELNIAEIFYESEKIQFRYSRYMSIDGSKWIRHGLFTAYHENGVLATEGVYEHGMENGAWRDYHANGQLAAEGSFEQGNEIGVWRYWNENGIEQA